MVGKRAKLMALSWVLGGALAACGGDDGGGQDTVFSGSQSASAPTADPSETGGTDSQTAEASGSSDDNSGEGSETGDTDGVPDMLGPGKCDETPAPGATPPPPPPPYSGGVCPQIMAGYNTGFLSQGRMREFALAVPENYDPTKSYPLVFGWYHLSGNAMDFVDILGADSLATFAQVIMVVPQETGDFEFVWPSTPLDNANAQVDAGFFDDLLACLMEQYSVNEWCVSSLGVSAGGLWTAYLGQYRGQYLSSNVVLSGGYPTEFGAVWWPWMASPHKFPALVVWGGPGDMLILDFHEASLNYISHAAGDGHTVMTCEHSNGHGIPPIEPGDTGPFDSILHFLRNHPRWLPASPLVTEGIPESYPDYCQLQ